MKIRILLSAVFALSALALSAQPIPYRTDSSTRTEWMDTHYTPDKHIDFNDPGRWWEFDTVIILEKALQYDQHTLEDEYESGDTTRRFQWDKISDYLLAVEDMNARGTRWGFLENYKNMHGSAPLTKEYYRNAHNMISDKYGVIRNQSVPVYAVGNHTVPERYGRDGSLVELLAEDDGWYRIENANYDGEWYVPEKFVRPMEKNKFWNVVFVDRSNQNICMVERLDGKWLIRSMNPATTGLNRPPYQYETPAGIFVLKDKKKKMYYLHDGTSEIAGYAPWANRITNGAYIHGIPTTSISGPIIEYSWSLGTTPRSHMCVRTASSHAKFIYDNAPVEETLVIIID